MKCWYTIIFRSEKLLNISILSDWITSQLNQGFWINIVIYNTVFCRVTTNHQMLWPNRQIWPSHQNRFGGLAKFCDQMTKSHQIFGQIFDDFWRLVKNLTKRITHKNVNKMFSITQNADKMCYLVNVFLFLNHLTFIS